MSACVHEHRCESSDECTLRIPKGLRSVEGPRLCTFTCRLLTGSVVSVRCAFQWEAICTNPYAVMQQVCGKLKSAVSQVTNVPPAACALYGAAAQCWQPQPHCARLLWSRICEERVPEVQLFVALHLRAGKGGFGKQLAKRGRSYHSLKARRAAARGGGGTAQAESTFRFRRTQQAALEMVERQSRAANRNAVDPSANNKAPSSTSPAEKKRIVEAQRNYCIQIKSAVAKGMERVCAELQSRDDDQQ